jgi:hypothetical protein
MVHMRGPCGVWRDALKGRAMALDMAYGSMAGPCRSPCRRVAYGGAYALCRHTACRAHTPVRTPHARRTPSARAHPHPHSIPHPHSAFATAPHRTSASPRCAAVRQPKFRLSPPHPTRQAKFRLRKARQALRTLAAAAAAAAAGSEGGKGKGWEWEAVASEVEAACCPGRLDEWELRALARQVQHMLPGPGGPDGAAAPEAEELLRLLR